MPKLKSPNRKPSRIRKLIPNRRRHMLHETFDVNEKELMRKLDELFSHVWMVRTFLKHCEEAEEDDELCDVHRTLYDCMHALGPAVSDGNATAYLKQARKKLRKLREATELFSEIQPEISSHTNFQMAEQSLRTSVTEISSLLET